MKIVVQKLLYRRSVQALCTKSLKPVQKSHVQELLQSSLCTERLYRSSCNIVYVQWFFCTEYTASVQAPCTERLYRSCTEASVQSVMSVRILLYRRHVQWDLVLQRN